MVFAAGPVPLDRTVVLSAPAIASLFSVLRGIFDLIVMGSSPLSVTSNASLAVGFSGLSGAVCRLDALCAFDLALCVNNIAAARSPCAREVVNPASSHQTNP